MAELAQMQLAASGLSYSGCENLPAHLVLRLSDNPDRPSALRSKEAFLVGADKPSPGFRMYVVVGQPSVVAARLGNEAPTVELGPEFSYLADGDVVRLQPHRGAARVLYRRNSDHNSFLVTERCNHYCLMCSQPPRNVDDQWIVDEILETIPLISPETSLIGFTGGEPTLLGADLNRLLGTMRSYLPRTAVHVLSNGRLFKDRAFAEAYSAVDHPDLMTAIPLYADVSTIHDYVVQSDGAFDDTVRGILNLKQLGQRVEVRFVIHQQTFARLPQFAEFLARNLTFVDHVALMGLEVTGFTLANLGELWIDPVDYKSELREAVEILKAHRMNTSIYNLQFCLLDESVWPYARQSISDWKNDYFEECDRCRLKSDCSGFFTSSNIKHSNHIKAFC